MHLLMTLACPPVSLAWIVAAALLIKSPEDVPKKVVGVGPWSSPAMWMETWFLPSRWPIRGSWDHLGNGQADRINLPPRLSLSLSLFQIEKVNKFF